MHGSLGHFKAVLQRRKNRLEKADGRFDKRKHVGSFSKKTSELNFSKPSPSELKRMKVQIRSRIKRQKIKANVLWVITVLGLFILFYFFIN